MRSGKHSQIHEGIKTTRQAEEEGSGEEERARMAPDWICFLPHPDPSKGKARAA